MKIRDIVERNRVMPHTAKPMGLIHKKGYGPNNRYGFKNVGNNRVNEDIEFTKPNTQYEWSEAQRYPYIKKLGFVGWNKLVNTGRQVNVSQFGGIRKIRNTTALNQPMAARELPKLEPDKVQRAQQSLKMGKFELPIVMKTPQGTLDLVAGNTRFTMMVAKGMTPTVWYIDASGLKENFDWVKLRTAKAVQPMLYYPGGIDPKTGKRVPPNVNQPNIITAVNLKQKLGPGEKLVPLSTRSMTDDQWKKYMDDWWAKNKNDPNAKAKIDQIKRSASMVKENFADGKVKGKSRPGRVKKAGASCAGSVTSLRAKAKKYGGEKGKMYHWCANMKSGKSKSK